MDNNNEHTKERALQEQFCLKKTTKGGSPFLLPYPDGCLCGREHTRQEKAVQEEVYGERWVVSGNFNYGDKGENILKHSSVSVVPKVLWLFNMRINRFSVKPGRLGLSEETLQVLS